MIFSRFFLVFSLFIGAGCAQSQPAQLPYFQFSGYQSAQKPIPNWPATVSVAQFGARGDDQADDAPAFNRAIQETKRGVIFVPPGRYVLRNIVKIERSDVVLRGAGPDKTVLVVPQSLSDLQGNQNVDGDKSRFAFSGGFVVLQGKERGQKLAAVAQPAKRGDTQLILDSTLNLPIGSMMRLQMRDFEHTLGRHLHADAFDAGTDTYKSLQNKAWIDWTARVVAIDGNRITLERPLRLDVRLEWQPEIFSSLPTVENSGVENLSFEFAGVPKKPHLQEEGFNAIQLSGVQNCWVKNVAISDADIGILANNSRFCTVENVVFRQNRRAGITGHHALWATGGTQESLFSDFRVETLYEHDLTVENRAVGNVFRAGSGVALNFDHHRNAPYENLFTNLDIGDARRLWQSGGRNDRGPNSGARATFWNIQAQKGLFSRVPNWPQINLFGVGTPIEPPDLYLSQLRSRH